MYARGAKKRHNCTWGGCARSVQCFSALRPGERGTTAAPTSEIEDSLKNLHRSCYRASFLEELVVVKTCLQSTFKAWGAPKRLGNTAQTLLLPPAKTTWSDSNGRYGLQMIIYTKNISVEKLAPPSLSRAADAKHNYKKQLLESHRHPLSLGSLKMLRSVHASDGTQCNTIVVRIACAVPSDEFDRIRRAVDINDPIRSAPSLENVCSGAYLGGSSYLLMPRLDETGTLYQQRATCPSSMTVSEQPAQFCVGECLHACTCGSTRTHRPGGNGRPGTRNRRKACTPL